MKSLRWTFHTNFQFDRIATIAGQTLQRLYQVDNIFFNIPYQYKDSRFKVYLDCHFNTMTSTADQNGSILIWSNLEYQTKHNTVNTVAFPNVDNCLTFHGPASAYTGQGNNAVCNFVLRNYDCNVFIANYPEYDSLQFLFNTSRPGFPFGSTPVPNSNLVYITITYELI